MGQAGDVESDPLHFWLLVGIGENARESRFDGDGELIAVRDGCVGWSEHAANFDGGMTGEINLAIELKRGAVAIRGVGNDAIVRGERDQSGSQLGILDDIKMKMALFLGGGDIDVDRKRGGRSAQTAHDGRGAILGDQSPTPE